MADVSYRACCIDDFTARSLKCDFIILYAHFCLVPIDVTAIKDLDVFVTIDMDSTHSVETLFSAESTLALFGPIQFNPTIHGVNLEGDKKRSRIITPQANPLSKGDVFGCTSARLTNVDAMVYIGDGRFHLQSAIRRLWFRQGKMLWVLLVRYKTWGLVRMFWDVRGQLERR